jgi:hypothetical protein
VGFAYRAAFAACAGGRLPAPHGLHLLGVQKAIAVGIHATEELFHPFWDFVSAQLAIAVFVKIRHVEGFALQPPGFPAASSVGPPPGLFGFP